MVKFESMGERMPEITKTLNAHKIKNLDEAIKICEDAGLNIDEIVHGVQPICFEDAVFAYTVGAAIALKEKAKSAEAVCSFLGEGLESFCLPGSVASERKIGLGHGNLGAMLLSEKTKCFCFLAGHESFAAAEGAIAIAKTANRARKTPLKVILNGLSKDAAYIISRVNGFTYVQTEFDHKTNKLSIIKQIPFGNGEATKVICYGGDDIMEGIAIMELNDVDVSITGNSTNPVRYAHLVAGIYKKKCVERGKKYFSVASGGGTGRTLHPDNVAAGPASYGLTDSMGKIHSDAQFAGSSSVPAHVEMMGFIGMGNNPIVGATVAIAVKVNEILNDKKIKAKKQK